jgi:hypothetical protein
VGREQVGREQVGREQVGQPPETLGAGPKSTDAKTRVVLRSPSICFMTNGGTVPFRKPLKLPFFFTCWMESLRLSLLSEPLMHKSSRYLHDLKSPPSKSVSSSSWPLNAMDGVLNAAGRRGDRAGAETKVRAVTHAHPDTNPVLLMLRSEERKGKGRLPSSAALAPARQVGIIAEQGVGARQIPP